jgi:hypothetical protein
MKVRRVKIRGKRWRIVIGRTPARRTDGYYRYTDRTIFIRPHADHFTTAIHEVLHACFPDLEESAVAECEEALVRVLSAIAPKL